MILDILGANLKCFLLKGLVLVHLEKNIPELLPSILQFYNFLIFFLIETLETQHKFGN